ncbi:MAG: hypothetical protein IPM27_08435 [Nitrosomonadales bacterium]|nr:hypothetical protein [Nitrosomonadales bacterium]
MDKNFHKRIIGICWLLMGALILSLLAVNFQTAETRVVAMGLAEGALFTASGFMLLAKLPKSWNLCLPCAALSLFSFPIGTVIGIYYLWYYFKMERVY